MKKHVVIICAGISGLSAAYFLKTPYTLLEAKPQAGGLCRSFYEDGFTYDCSGHFIHIKDEKIKKLVNGLAGGVEEVERKASIYLKEKLIPFPFQANLYYLDQKTKKECVDGILKRKDGDVSTSMPYIDWSMAMFGAGITKYFMRPYNQKLWSYDLKKMTALWSGHFVPKPDAETMIKSAYAANRQKYGYNSVFYYPKQRGCQALVDGLLKKVKVETNSKTQKIDIKSKTVFTENGKKIKYTDIISTQPLTELVKQINGVPPTVKKAADKLVCNSVRCINLGVKAKNGVPKILRGQHWLYIPETKFPFYRVGIYSNVSASAAPKGHYSLYVEFSTIGSLKDLKDIKDLKVLNVLKKTGLIGKYDEIVSVNITDMPHAYVIFDKNRQASLDTINEFLIKNGIYSIGRYGAWEYSFIEKNIKDAMSAASLINGESR